MKFNMLIPVGWPVEGGGQSSNFGLAYLDRKRILSAGFCNLKKLFLFFAACFRRDGWPAPFMNGPISLPNAAPDGGPSEFVPMLFKN